MFDSRWDFLIIIIALLIHHHSQWMTIQHLPRYIPKQCLYGAGFNFLQLNFIHWKFIYELPHTAKLLAFDPLNHSINQIQFGSCWYFRFWPHLSMEEWVILLKKIKKQSMNKICKANRIEIEIVEWLLSTWFNSEYSNELTHTHKYHIVCICIILTSIYSTSMQNAYQIQL